MMFNFSTLSAVIIILFILVFLFLCILRCRMRRAEHKEHDLYNLFFSRSAHRGSILVPDDVGPEASTRSKRSRTPEAGSSGPRPKREKRRHSVHTISVGTGKNTPLHTDSAGISGRRGSAPVDLLSHSIEMYKGSELTDRQSLFRCNHELSTSFKKNRRRGSAPVNVLTHSIDLYKGNELTDRHRLYRGYSDAAYSHEKNRSLGSAPINLRTNSLPLYNRGEQADRHFRSNPSSSFRKYLNGTGFKTTQTNIPEEVEIKYTAS